MADTAIRNFGTITAYKYAKDHGFTGTEDQFGEMMANIVEYHDESMDAVTTTTANARTASTAAQNAENSESNALTYKNNAQTYANNANQSAYDANSYMTQAANSAAQALLDASDAEAFAAGTRDGVAVESGDAAYHNNSKYYAQDAAASASLALNPALVTEEISGSVASCEDGARASAIVDWTADIKPVQSSGNPTPTSVKAISGWAKLTAIQAGKNIYPKRIGRDTFTTTNGATYTWGDNDELVITVPANQSSNLDFGVMSTIGERYYLTRVCEAARKSGRQAYLSFKAKASTQMSFRYGSDGINSVATLNTDYTKIIYPITNGSTGRYFFARHGAGENATITITDAMVSFDDNTDYVPFDGHEYSISWNTQAGTIYGGNLDITTGILTVDRVSVELGSLSYNKTTYGGSVMYFTSSSAIGGAVCPGSANELSNILCEIYKPVTQAEIDNVVSGSLTYGICLTTDGKVRIKDTRYTDVDEFKAMLGTRKLVYRTSNPATYQLTPQEVSTFLGSNSFYTNTGDSTVTYHADTKLYIDKRLNATKALIGGVEAEYKATKNYTIGQYLVVGDNLYKVTSAIATGGSITPGTNVTATTVAEQLVTLANA